MANGHSIWNCPIKWKYNELNYHLHHCYLLAQCNWPWLVCTSLTLFYAKPLYLCWLTKKCSKVYGYASRRHWQKATAIFIDVQIPCSLPVNMAKWQFIATILNTAVSIPLDRVRVIAFRNRSRKINATSTTIFTFTFGIQHNYAM